MLLISHRKSSLLYNFRDDFSWLFFKNHIYTVKYVTIFFLWIRFMLVTRIIEIDKIKYLASEFTV